MNASIVVAICATVIAVLSLAVSVYEARATRRHDRISVRPHLALQANLRQGSQAGLQLINAGLGPAAITPS
jgi:predicted lysophospholipase L1 biosynthesis ABC-type transport system permease subunit